MANELFFVVYRCDLDTDTESPMAVIAATEGGANRILRLLLAANPDGAWRVRTDPYPSLAKVQEKFPGLALRTIEEVAKSY